MLVTTLILSMVIIMALMLALFAVTPRPRATPLVAPDGHDRLKIMLGTDARPPTRAHKDDAGLDLTATSPAMIRPGQRRTISTGVRVAIPKGHVGLMFSRSGHGTRDGITLANSVGVIDASYRGEVKACLVNHSDRPVEVQAGERIAQLVIVPMITPTPQRVAMLDGTTRGTGGFGSTGKAA